MTKLQRQLIEFHRTFEHPIASSPSTPSDERVRLRAALIMEEAFEFLEAVFEKEDTTDEPFIERCRGMTMSYIKGEFVKVDLVAAADALADIDYVVEGSRLEFGINGGPIADEVHRSNMAKKGGQKRDDGKTLKPAGWTPPNIKGCLDAQSLGASMESNRHVFMRKLLELCYITGVTSGVPIVVTDVYGKPWIDEIEIEANGWRAAGFWDGERHEVRL